MQPSINLWNDFLQASFLIQFFFLLLAIFSLIAWTIIIQNFFLLRHVQKSYDRFDRQFWSGTELTEFYQNLPETIPSEEIASLFYAGFTEFLRLRQSSLQNIHTLLKSVERAIGVAHTQAMLAMERSLNWLLIISITSPYIGILVSLFKIVSILRQLNAMNASVLGDVVSSVIDIFGIIVMSLLTTIPTIIFYYRSFHQIERLSRQYHIFQEEFLALLFRQIHEEAHDAPLSSK